MKDDRNPAVWLQCLQAASNMIVRHRGDDGLVRHHIAEDTALLADKLYHQYDQRFGLQYAKDGSGRVVSKEQRSKP